MAKLIGTAGHVDHGKTTLIKALTGIDADRLPEEKRRGMTIDVGFAFVDLPRHGRVSIVDVPGHQKFLTNMLVGALGIDVALLCVAADAGVMPQTREHLQILELLPVSKLVVALTRGDLADDDTRAIAQAYAEELVAASRFKEAPILSVSATTGEGLDALRTALDDALDGPEAPTDGPWYLPIDRAFNVHGHGCVVTGTLAQGRVNVGDRAFLEPGHIEVRIRGIEIHGEPAETSERGQRTALNLAGVRLEQLHRGMSLGAPGVLFETRVLDARIHWVGPHRHGQNVRVSVGAEEAIAKLFLNDHDRHLVQLRVEQPIAVAQGQPLILRRYSPPDLVGGGRIVVPEARPRKKKEAVQTVRASNAAQGILEVVGDDPNGVATDEICRRLGKTPQALGNDFERLTKDEKILGFAGLWMSPAAFAEGFRRFEAALLEVHEAAPTQSTVPRERVVSRAGLTWAGKPLDRILARLATEGRVAVHGTGVRHPAVKPKLSEKQRALLERVVGEIEREPVNVPSLRDISLALGVPPPAVEEILRVGIQTGEILLLGEGLFYTPRQIDALKERVRELSQGKPFAPAAMREALGTSRKYIIPLLEHLDSVRFTTRVGDNRVVR